MTFNPLLFYEYGKSRNVFTSTWKTDNTSTGSSTATQVKLPLTSAGSYNFRVDWGDGNSDTITVWNQAQTTHTYSIAGTYQIKITGTLRGWAFSNTGDRLKILSVQRWGALKFTTAGGGNFNGCANLILTEVSDVLDLSFTNTLSTAFANCTSITTINRINEWNTSTIVTLNSCFNKSRQFNDNIGAWNVSNVSDFRSMFECAFMTRGLFNNGGSPDINNWNTSSATLTGDMFYNSGFNQPVGNWNMANVTAMFNMFRESNFNQNIGAWNVTKVTNFNTMFFGTTVFNNGGSGTIGNWIINTLAPVTMASMFQGSTSFNQNIGAWDVSSVTDMGGMFQSATSFNQNIGAWNTGNVTNMRQMFFLASAFNNGGSNTINSWDTTKVTTMYYMFRSAVNFNQPIGSWNVANVTIQGDLNGGMFHSATSFNQDIGAWNVTKISDFSNMFLAATAFNNGGSNTINNWVIKTSGAVIMNAMFASCTNFNQPLGSWNVSTVNSMASMFTSTFNFNQPLNTWNTGAVVNMSNMFNNATAFNQDIGGWNTVSVTTMASMFQNATAFNNGGSSSINGWNTSNVTNMSGMFFGQGGGVSNSFNQPIGNWDVTKVTNMSNMFFANGRGVPFNQDIGAWSPSLVNNFTSFMASKTPANFSTTNLDAIYNGWTNKILLPTQTITFGTIKYTAAATAAKALLTRANATQVITNAADNGSGLIRITSNGHGRATGDKIFISGVLGTTEANGGWIITVIDANTFDLQGSTFTNVYTSAGTLRTGYGWTVVDGGL